MPFCTQSEHTAFKTSENMIIVVRKQVLAYIPAIYSELCIECKITWHNQGDMELSCENENHHRNGTLHL